MSQSSLWCWLFQHKMNLTTVVLSLTERCGGRLPAPSTECKSSGVAWAQGDLKGPAKNPGGSGFTCSWAILEGGVCVPAPQCGFRRNMPALLPANSNWLVLCQPRQILFLLTLGNAIKNKRKWVTSSTQKEISLQREWGRDQGEETPLRRLTGEKGGQDTNAHPQTSCCVYCTAP